MNGLSPEMQEKARLIQARFAVKLLPKLEEMSVQLALVRQQPVDRTLLHVLYRQLHSLAGSAGTFGFAELGERARLLEYQVLAWHDGAGCTAADFDTIAAGLLELEAIRAK